MFSQSPIQRTATSTPPNSRRSHKAIALICSHPLSFLAHPQMRVSYTSTHI
ncbi:MULTISPECIES: hypothetical protein [unclassified Nostoc]|uniref:hypothetical protein n=1 Tax=unclassified Nostoc TaxID=2593658 RepID=UPI002AD249FE|nr:hypothetical protein [Nostoc sp. DedQUE03]MDZ7971824.1 hypothetical protein [Nostoc sp. DedQUE03]